MRIFNLDKLSDDFFEKIEFENIASVSEIISDVKVNKDEALRRYSMQFGDGELDRLEVSE